MYYRSIGPAIALILATTVQGLWVPPDDKVPTERLIENLQAQLAATPDDPHLLARLGRIYSLRYSLGDREVEVRKDRNNGNLSLYEQGNGYPSARHHLAGEAIIERISDLHQALAYYEAAARVKSTDDKDAYIWLGLGYVRDEMSHAAAYLAAPLATSEDDELRVLFRTAWEDRALEAYQKAIGTKNEINGGFLTPPVELEAARYVKMILDARKNKSGSHRDLLKTADNIVRSTIGLPRAVTPIILSLHEEKALADLLAPEITVNFDLDGTESGLSWPWVKPDTAFLVWDGDGLGNVPSGRQLIGSVTWWLFWEHGYAVLAALDNNRDGWLYGNELEGLAVWQDWNGNGVSDTGEVRSLATVGIQGLATTLTGQSNGMPMNAQGVELTDGRQLPTYDWIVSPVE